MDLDERKNWKKNLRLEYKAMHSIFWFGNFRQFRNRFSLVQLHRLVEHEILHRMNHWMPLCNGFGRTKKLEKESKVGIQSHALDLILWEFSTVLKSILSSLITQTCRAWNSASNQSLNVSLQWNWTREKTGKISAVAIEIETVDPSIWVFSTVSKSILSIPTAEACRAWNSAWNESLNAFLQWNWMREKTGKISEVGIQSDALDLLVWKFSPVSKSILSSPITQACRAWNSASDELLNVSLQWIWMREKIGKRSVVGIQSGALDLLIWEFSTCLKWILSGPITLACWVWNSASNEWLYVFLQWICVWEMFVKCAGMSTAVLDWSCFRFFWGFQNAFCWRLVDCRGDNKIRRLLLFSMIAFVTFY